MAKRSRTTAKVLTGLAFGGCALALWGLWPTPGKLELESQADFEARERTRKLARTAGGLTGLLAGGAAVALSSK